MIDINEIRSRYTVEKLNELDSRELTRNAIAQMKIDLKGLLSAIESGELRQVVRCKDCEYQNKKIAVDRMYYCIIHQRMKSPDYFCACGRRKGR